MKTRKLPQRMCAGCKEQKPKKELIRVVRSPQGEISMDLTGKKSGRGVYLCNSLECLRLARKSRRLERSLACQIPQEIYEQLEGALLDSEE